MLCRYVDPLQDGVSNALDAEERDSAVPMVQTPAASQGGSSGAPRPLKTQLTIRIQRADSLEDGLDSLTESMKLGAASIG